MFSQIILHVNQVSLNVLWSNSIISEIEQEQPSKVTGYFGSKIWVSYRRGRLGDCCVKIISELLLIDAENERAKKCLSFDDLFEKPTMFWSMLKKDQIWPRVEPVNYYLLVSEDDAWKKQKTCYGQLRLGGTLKKWRYFLSWFVSYITLLIIQSSTW